MARLNILPRAARAIRALPKDRTLLTAIWRHIEQAADAPVDHILPPAFPYPWPMLNFQVDDATGQHWAVTVLVRFDQDADILTVILLHAGPVAADIDI